MTIYPPAPQYGQQNVGRRVEITLLGLLLAVVIGLGMHGVRLGWGHDANSRSIFERSIPAILQGSYLSGRSFGNPLYEYLAAHLYTIGGTTLVNIYSLILAIGSVFIFHGLLNQTDPLHRIFALIGFALSPLFLINSSSFGEWMQTYFFIVCLLWSAKRWLNDPRVWYLFLYGLFSSLLVLTRPDAALVCVCTWVALMWQRHFGMIESLKLATASAVAGAVTFTIFVLLNGGISFLHNAVWDQNTWSRTLVIAIVDIFNLFGFGTAVWSAARYGYLSGLDEEQAAN